MNAKMNALNRVKIAYEGLEDANEVAVSLRGRLAEKCREARKAGANDREIAEAIGNNLSRARIQQLRNDNSRVQTRV